MKILIYGSGSYIGTHLSDALTKKGHNVYSIDAIKNTPSEIDYTGVDSIINVAGIAHVNITPEMENLFYKVNTNLAIELCRKAYMNGVKQYIYMSSMNVFGDTSECIYSRSQENPKNFYGRSKLLADQGIHAMATENFKVVSVRPPVVYGKGCKGNFSLLIKLAKYMPVFPYFENTKSMIHIDNLSNFICKVIENGDSGIFHPQNAEHTNISEIIKEVRLAMGKKTYIIHGFGWFVKSLMKLNHKVERAFANDFYDLEFSKYRNENYSLVSFKKSIKKSI